MRQIRMRQIRMRKVVKGDRGPLVSIIEGSGNLTGEEKDCALELLDIYFNDPSQDDYLFIAATGEGDVPVGYVCYGQAALASGVYEIYWIVVSPGEQRSGIGRRLIHHTESVVKGEGARMLLVETSGQPAYEGVRSFYKRCGYEEEARVRSFFKPGDDKVIYVKNL